MLPSQHTIDYEAILSVGGTERKADVAAFLQDRLPFRWRDVYVSAVARPVHLVRLQLRRFQYICDLYSRIEMVGEVPYNQAIEDRVVAVFGTTSRAEEDRDASRIRRWAEATEQLFESERDRGHFMAHCIGGGGLEVNVFSQDRHLNRGWSPQGKVYRRMERYCYEQAATFCFSRPIYADGSSVPRWLEFGVLKKDRTLWVEVFDN